MIRFPSTTITTATTGVMRCPVVKSDAVCYWKDMWQKLDRMRRDWQLCDVTLITVDDKSFMAHSPVLAASSDRFHELLTARGESGGGGGGGNRIALDGVTSDVLATTLDFIYGVTPTERVAFERLRTGAKLLGIDSAYEYCSRRLSELDTGNAEVNDDGRRSERSANVVRSEESSQDLSGRHDEQLVLLKNDATGSDDLRYVVDFSNGVAQTSNLENVENFCGRRVTHDSSAWHADVSRRGTLNGDAGTLLDNLQNVEFLDGSCADDVTGHDGSASASCRGSTDVGSRGVVVVKTTTQVMQRLPDFSENTHPTENFPENADVLEMPFDELHAALFTQMSLGDLTNGMRCPHLQGIMGDDNPISSCLRDDDDDDGPRDEEPVDDCDRDDDVDVLVDDGLSAVAHVPLKKRKRSRRTFGVGDATSDRNKVSETGIVVVVDSSALKTEIPTVQNQLETTIYESTNVTGSACPRSNDVVVPTANLNLPPVQSRGLPSSDTHATVLESKPKFQSYPEEVAAFSQQEIVSFDRAGPTSRSNYRSTYKISLDAETTTTPSENRLFFDYELQENADDGLYVPQTFADAFSSSSYVHPLSSSSSYCYSSHFMSGCADDSVPNVFVAPPSSYTSSGFPVRSLSSGVFATDVAAYAGDRETNAASSSGWFRGSYVNWNSSPGRTLQDAAPRENESSTEASYSANHNAARVYKMADPDVTARQFSCFEPPRTLLSSLCDYPAYSNENENCDGGGNDFSDASHGTVANSSTAGCRPIEICPSSLVDDATTVAPLSSRCSADDGTFVRTNGDAKPTKEYADGISEIQDEDSKLQSSRRPIDRKKRGHVRKDVATSSTNDQTRAGNRLPIDRSSAEHQCQYCLESFKSSYKLQTHQLKVHGKGKLFSCQECSFKSPRKKDVQAHMLSQHGTAPTGVKVYGCSHCDYKCIDRNRFEEHEAKHTGITSHRCPLCSRAYTTKRGMRTHLKYHSEDRPHKCDLCGAAFKVTSKLSDHMKLIHIQKGVKPYQCGYCSHATALRGNCNQHIRKNHPGQALLIIDKFASKRKCVKEYDYAGMAGDGIEEHKDLHATRPNSTHDTKELVAL